jgi:hypothetical protein
MIKTRSVRGLPETRREIFLALRKVGHVSATTLAFVALARERLSARPSAPATHTPSPIRARSRTRGR